MDLSKPAEAGEIISRHHPDVVLNATAYTAVDRAESEPELARAINGIAPGFMADQARQIGAAFIHYSTDYVFDGTKGSPYVESDATNPLNEYGRSKLEGERAVIDAGGAYLILRTSWVYSTRKESFVSKVLSWSRQQETLRIVSDQVSNPTWCRMLAGLSAQLLVKGGRDFAGWLGERAGLYHLAGSGFGSRLDWAQAILAYDPHREEQVVREIQPALTEEFPSPAQRPLFSALNCDRFQETFGLQLPDWKDALKMAME
jgi:dTDP-4-dehydrorhamnose reductase